IYVFHGDDSRPAYLSGLYNSCASSSQIESVIKLISTQKETLRKIERYADLIISHPPSSQLHEKPIVSFVLIGIPYSYNGGPIDRNKKRSDAQVVRILHAPSDQEVKGSRVIRQAIENLQSRGHRIEFIQITEKTNAEVMKELANCDFVVDQLYSDT